MSTLWLIIDVSHVKIYTHGIIILTCFYSCLDNIFLKKFACSLPFSGVMLFFIQNFVTVLKRLLQIHKKFSETCSNEYFYWLKMF